MALSQGFGRQRRPARRSESLHVGKKPPLMIVSSSSTFKQTHIAEGPGLLTKRITASQQATVSMMSLPTRPTPHALRGAFIQCLRIVANSSRPPTCRPSARFFFGIAVMASLSPRMTDDLRSGLNKIQACKVAPTRSCARLKHTCPTKLHYMQQEI